MIRLAWRQFRVQAVAALAALVVVAVVAAATRPGLVDILATASATQPRIPGPYLLLRDAFILIVVAAPVLIGVFWGAPLIARELETGTFRLAWTQSVTRRRWLTRKFLVVGLSSILLAGLLSLIVTWWSNPMNGIDFMNAPSPNRFGLLLFSAGGIAPLGYGAFGFVLGVTAGLLFRRTLPAMAVSLAGFAAIRLAVTYWVRPYFMSPALTSLSLTDPAVDIEALGSPATGITHVEVFAHIPNAWVYSAEMVDKAGSKLTSEAVQSIGTPGSPGALAEKLGMTYQALVTYQPAGRFWAFQGIETAAFLGLAILLAGLCFWWVRRRAA